jgi:hypothetical protein
MIENAVVNSKTEISHVETFMQFVYFTLSILSTATLGDTKPTQLRIKLLIASQYIIGLCIFAVLLVKAL